MASVIVLYNPLDTSRRRNLTLPDDVQLLAWLEANEPAPARATRVVYLNGRVFDPLTKEDAAYRTRPTDEILVCMRPGEAISAATIISYIVQALVTAAISYVISRIFAPSKPKAANTPSPSQVYGLSTPRNAARLGEPIPVIYGKVVAVPDYAAQPYTEYENQDQYLYALFCLGQGYHEVSEMLIGASSAALLPAGIATYTLYGPNEHASTFGIIQAATGVRENVVTSADVSDQELLAPNETNSNTPSTWYWQATNVRVTDTPPAVPPAVDMTDLETDEQRLAKLMANPPLGTVRVAIYDEFYGGLSFRVIDYIATAYKPTTTVPQYSLVPPPGGPAGVAKWVGPFETCKAGQEGSSLELDFVFANGLFSMDKSGNLLDRTVEIAIERTRIDDSGAATAAPVLATATYTAATNTAQRFTYKIATSSPGRFKVRVHRVTNSDKKTTTSDRVFWTGLKFQLRAPPAGTVVYGNVSLVAVKLRAKNAIASDAASSIRFRTTRRLRPPSGGSLAPTVNPADAFADVIVAAYGGNRPRNDEELDLTTLEAARTRWASHNGFNAVFDQPSTVWEALSMTVQTVSAAPLPIGSRFTVLQDGVQPVRAQMFGDGNTLAGSMQITHDFDRDGTPAGIRVEYRDPRTFSAAAFMLPEGAPDYETINLFGCTSAAVAAEHAQLLANRRQLQRTSIQFQTELEGLSCLPGDRIGVQTGMANWGQGARVVSVDGLTLTVDTPLAWVEGQPHKAQLRDAEGHPVAVNVTRGATDYELVCASLPFAPIGFSQAAEATLVAFGVSGQEITDWTVVAMQPQGDTVTIQAVNYEPDVWAGAARHLMEPLPFDEVTR